MSTPTVRISAASHQILRSLAEQTGHTMIEILDKALDAYRREVFLEGVNAGYLALRADPKAWAEVEKERRSMAGSALDGLDPKESWGDDGDLLPANKRKKHG